LQGLGDRFRGYDPQRDLPRIRYATASQFLVLAYLGLVVSLCDSVEKPSGTDCALPWDLG